MGGLPLYDEKNLLDRQTALKLWTKGSAWFSGESCVKGALKQGELADLVVLSDDYFSIDPEEIKNIESVMTVLGGKIVYAAAEFKQDDSPLPPASPTWSPVRKFGGYWRATENRNAPSHQSLQAKSAACACTNSCGMHGHSHAWVLDVPVKDKKSFWGALGCSCFAF